MRLEGKRALIAGLVAGALAALAMPPFNWLPLAVVGIVVFVWLWDGASTPRIALWRGWAWGLGHFAVGCYWVVEPFFVPPADFAPLGPPAVLGLAVVLGFFPAAAMAAAKWVALRRPYLGGRYRRLLLLAIAWTMAEWLRGHLFTGFPWNPLGHVWTFATPLLQGAAVFGVYGLGAVTFLILAAPAAGWRASMAALVAIAGAVAAGFWVMPPKDSDQAGQVVVRIVQPNISQSEKWQPDSRQRHLARLLELSRRPGLDHLAAVIWPETAVPFAVQPGSPILPVLATAVPPGGYLLAGAERVAERPEDGIWNSLLVLDRRGEVRAHYDKVHLVPFGEYIPFHKEFGSISTFVGRGSFDMGEEHVTLDLPGLPGFAPVICYEAIFPGEIVGPKTRPSWIVNITNDGWFGVSSGPYQHLASARLRTIEEGLPMLRAANTGVSAVIDAYGRVLRSLDMEREGIIDHELPPARSPTLYSRWHDWTLLILLVAIGSLAAVRTRTH